jgi:hypothetical protein
MRIVSVAVLLLVWMVLAIGIEAQADTEEQGWSHLKQYWGRVESINVDTCGQASESCEARLHCCDDMGARSSWPFGPRCGSNGRIAACRSRT